MYVNVDQGQDVETNQGAQQEAQQDAPAITVTVAVELTEFQLQLCEQLVHGPAVAVILHDNFIDEDMDEDIAELVEMGFIETQVAGRDGLLCVVTLTSLLAQFFDNLDSVEFIN